MKNVLRKILKVLGLTVLYAVILVSSIVYLFKINLIFDIVDNSVNHNSYSFSCLIPMDHADILLRKKIADTSFPKFKMIPIITKMDVFCDADSKPVEYKTVKMGRYPQSQNAIKPIEWLVIDEKYGRTLLLSKYYLDAVNYDNRIDNISWEKSQLRRWLNDDFYRSAFNKEEQKEIKTSLIESDMYTFGEWDEAVCPSRMTKDKLFVLDPHEKGIYLMMTGNDYYSEPTEYAKKQAGSDIKIADWSRFGAVPNIACQKCWGSWPADGKHSGYYTLKDVLCPKEDDNYVLYVRPAMWVDSGYVRKLKERQ